MTPEMYLMQVKDIDLRIRSLKGELKDAENENDEVYAEELRKRINEDIKRYKEIKKIKDEPKHGRKQGGGALGQILIFHQHLH